MYASDYRRTAREVLRGKWKIVMPLMLLAQAVYLYFGLDEIYMQFFSRPLYLSYGNFQIVPRIFYYWKPVGVGWGLLAGILALEICAPMVAAGEYRVMESLYRGERPETRQLFPRELFGKALAMNVVRGILIFLQSLLLIVPGVIATYRYAMADYLLAENPQLGPIEALRESGKYMKGNKAALFFMQLSFIGWALLAALPMEMLNLGFNGSIRGLSALIYAVVVPLLTQSPLRAYMLAAETAFYRNALRSETRAREESAAWNEVREEAPADDAARESEGAYTVLGVDETVARDLFLQHGCSRNRLRMAGLLEEYERLRPSPSSEAGWYREHCDELMRRFDRDPAALDELLSLSAEYADEWLADRALQRIDRHIRQETLPDAEILGMAGRMLAMLTSGAFAGSEGFVGRKCEQVSDMADRLEQRLRAQQPDEGWESTLELVRKMCARV